VTPPDGPHSVCPLRGFDTHAIASLEQRLMIECWQVGPRLPAVISSTFRSFVSNHLADVFPRLVFSSGSPRLAPQLLHTAHGLAHYDSSALSHNGYLSLRNHSSTFRPAPPAISAHYTSSQHSAGDGDDAVSPRRRPRMRATRSCFGSPVPSLILIHQCIL